LQSQHRLYIETMLTNKLKKRYPDEASQRIISNELSFFFNNDLVNRDSIQSLEGRINRKLDQNKKLTDMGMVEP